ncbi:mycothiol-dependent nitroreductase Rv2466c family protein [Streptomyces sp. NPDC004096]|uniref:mycothiol-dependent nitroreductase Rv2466c family protein n=1 Tax=unclassified Streptomyces TaxID=2593676 RepID=UPI0033AFB5FA
MTASASPASPIPVDFYADPICPWTWLTSRWLLDVADRRPIKVSWHVMSLAILNENRMHELPERIRLLMGDAWAPVRVLTAARLIHGPEVVEPLYTALGTRYHLQQQPKNRATLEGGLRDAGLPVDLAAAGDTDRYDEELRASHTRGITLVGEDVGSPIIAVPGATPGSDPVAFFGPVVNPAPKGEDAAQLWDGVITVASTPNFYEIKRTRTGGPDFS